MSRGLPAEAAHFLDISQKLEAGGEVAHADVLKAHIQAQQQQRDLQESQLAMERSRLDLAVMLFPDFNQNFTVVDDLQSPESLPTFAEVAAAGQKNNPDLRAALAAYQVAGHEVTAAWGGLLPSLDAWITSTELTPTISPLRPMASGILVIRPSRPCRFRSSVGEPTAAS